MKTILSKTLLSSFVVIFLFCFSGCKKDRGCAEMYTYTYFTPVYQTAAVVRANIKSDAPRSIVNPGKIYIKGNYIFLNEVDKGIHIIDNTNPAAPRNVSFINLPGNVDIAVKGNTMYADFYTELVVLDISESLNIRVKKFVENIFADRYYYGYNVDSTLVITDWVMKTETVNMGCDRRNILFEGVMMNSMDAGFSATSAASSPVGIAGSLARFALVNNYLYSVSHDSLRVVNVSLPYEPAYVNSISLGWGIETISPFKDKLFIGSQSGMFIYGLQNPSNPTKLGTFSHVRTCDPVIADGEFAYVTLFSGNTCAGFTNQLDVLNISNINNPTLVKTYQLSSPRGLSKDGALLFICDARDGLTIFNAADPRSITLKKTFNIPQPTDVIAFNNLALVVAGDGLYQYDYSDANNIRFVSKISVP